MTKGSLVGLSIVVTAILCFLLGRPGPDPNGATVQITPSSSVGARLAAADDAYAKDVPSYEARLEQVSRIFKENPSRIMGELQKSAKALQKDGNSATMSEYLGGLSMLSSYQPWQTISFYCQAYEEARKEGVSNDQAWLSASYAASPPKK